MEQRFVSGTDAQFAKDIEYWSVRGWRVIPGTQTAVQCHSKLPPLSIATTSDAGWIEYSIIMEKTEDKKDPSALKGESSKGDYWNRPGVWY